MKALAYIRTVALLLFGGMLLAGCQAAQVAGLANPQPAARDFTLRSEPSRRVDASVPRIYLIRGLAQTVSEGVDHLAAKLNARGYRATVHAYGDWPAIASQIIADKAASGGRSHAVIVGHSLGANSTVHAVNALAERNAAADLAVAFDPTEDLQVNGGVRRFINFYQSDNGWGRVVQAGPHAQGRVENIDLKAMEHLTHFTIDRDAQVHERVIVAIRQMAGEPGSQIARAPEPAR
jgi:hypothetical protein